MVSQDQVGLFVKHTSQFYKACLANGFFMPPLKNHFVSQKFMLEIYEGKCFCPKQVDVKPLVCLNPPTNLQLVDIIATMIEQNG